jgi:histidinol phosphatase-like PHP family hydrolase
MIRSSTAKFLRLRSQAERAQTRRSEPVKGAVTNAALAELLAIEAEKARPPLTRAFRSASRRAFLWPQEAADVVRSGRSLAELQGVGPYLERVIRGWLADPPSMAAPPSLRSGFLTFTQAQSILNSRPDWLPSIRGDLQMHSLWSDGEDSIADMSAAAAERGYEYIAITDHAKTLKIAGGLDEHRLRDQGKEIDRVNRRLASAGKNLQVLRSIELNLNPGGEGDMDPGLLAELDIVIGCFHSSLRRKEDQTDRYLAALRNPDIQILGHPRGRVYNYRAGLSADWPRVFELAAQLGKAVEIDAYPDRQDLSSDLLILARKAGCHISFGTDAHGASQLRFMVFAAASAVQTGINRDHILNFMPRERLRAWVNKVRRHAASS